MLKKVISGAQTGADIAGLRTAKRFGIETGGTMPFGYKAYDRCHPEYRDEFGVVAHTSSSYVPRTRLNVKDSDGTIRFAYNFDSAGEICTKKAIDDHSKPWMDVDLNVENLMPLVAAAIMWIEDSGIEVLNVAGNRERDGTIEERVSTFLSDLFQGLGHKELQDAND